MIAIHEIGVDDGIIQVNHTIIMEVFASLDALLYNTPEYSLGKLLIFHFCISIFQSHIINRLPPFDLQRYFENRGIIAATLVDKQYSLSTK